jgi:threonine aldolase
MPIDLRSDTVTRPTAGMRRAMAEAEVGDDVLDGDPTVQRLEARVAELLGHERGLFFPSGTMANQSAIWVLSERGTEILADANSHLVDLELVGAAALCGVQIRPVVGDGPMMNVASLERAFRPPVHGAPRATLVCLENTHNGAGGLVTPLGGIDAMTELARRRGCRVHLDGARLWNAAVATGTSLHDYASGADTVMVSFSKGLGAPVGAVLAGDVEEITASRESRRRFGGAMRQSGVLAAAALYGLEHHYARLADDHANATYFASLVEGAPLAVIVPPETNIVMIDLTSEQADAAEVAQRCAERGVLVGIWTPTRLRVVFHLDVTRDDTRVAAEVFLGALEAVSRERALPV